VLNRYGSACPCPFGLHLLEMLIVISFSLDYLEMLYCRAPMLCSQSVLNRLPVQIGAHVVFAKRSEWHPNDGSTEDSRDTARLPCQSYGRRLGGPRSPERF
jgi:hypothetical protein